MKKVAIVIPFINLWEQYTKPCLQSIEERTQQAEYQLTVYLVDNASSDGSRAQALMQQYKTFVLDYTYNYKRMCCAESWNYGVTKAFKDGNEYVLVANNDVLFHPLTFDVLFERMKKGDVAMVTGNNIRIETTPTELKSFQTNAKWDEPESEHPDFSCFMIDRRCWDVVGPFDSNFKPAYFEDNDYHYRMKLAGYKAISFPPAVYYHYGSKTQLEALGNGRLLVPSSDFNKNREYFARKWGGTPGQETFKTPFNL